MWWQRNLFWFFILVICSTTIYSQNSTYSEDSTQILNEVIAKPKPKPNFRVLIDSLSKINIKFLPFPIISYSPETGVLYGAGLDYFFNLRKKPADTLTRESLAYFVATYSTRQQLNIEAQWNIFGPFEKYIFRGRMGYNDFSENYWGIGNNTLPEKEFVKLTYSNYIFRNRYYFNQNKNFFWGANINYSNTQRIEFSKEVNDKNDIFGFDKSLVVGIGPNLLFDYRDNPFSPTKGWYLEFYGVFNGKYLGSKFNYSEHQIDFRKYYAPAPKTFIGFQVFSTFTHGDVPLRELPRIGGGNIMRGYINGRYRDRQTWASQVEMRYHLLKRLNLAAFYGVSQVSPTILTFKNQPLITSGGGGVRFLFNPKKHLYSRIDFAKGTNNTGYWYIRIGDAF